MRGGGLHGPCDTPVRAVEDWCDGGRDIDSAKPSTRKRRIPRHDPRSERLCKNHEKLEDFLGGFKTALGFDVQTYWRERPLAIVAMDGDKITFNSKRARPAGVRINDKFLSYRLLSNFYGAGEGLSVEEKYIFDSYVTGPGKSVLLNHFLELRNARDPSAAFLTTLNQLDPKRGGRSIKQKQFWFFEGQPIWGVLGKVVRRACKNAQTRKLVQDYVAARFGTQISFITDVLPSEILDANMYKFLQQKFRDPTMKALLMSTQDRAIEEVGMRGKPTSGRLGKLLVKLRSELRNSASSGEHATSERQQVFTDEEIFEVNSNTTVRGFKNVTTVVTLNTSIGTFRSGQNVFVKIGESEENVAFALACNSVRKAVGLFSVPQVMLWIRVAVNWPRIASRTKAKWAKPMKARLKRSLSLYSRNGALPALLSEVVDGTNGRDKGLRWNARHGLDLLKVLLFRKYVGSHDTSPGNVVVDSSFNILSVDENMANEAQLEDERFFCHSRFSATLRRAIFDGLCQFPQETAKFIAQLQSAALPPPINKSARLLEVHSKAPFDVETARILKSGNAEEVSALAQRLVDAPASRKRKAP